LALRHTICTQKLIKKSNSGAFFSVAEYRKKIIASVAAALYAAVPIFFCCQANPAEATVSPPGNTSTSSANTPNFYATRTDNLSGRELFYRMMLSVILIVILGGAAMYISKKFLPKIVNPPGKNIRIIETTHLGNRKMVHLLKIGERKLLIGSTNENITMLADVTDALTNKIAQDANEG
jgi:flagellar biosynthetic protein FliO